MSDQLPRPNLNLDKDYIDNVAGLITGKGELEEIHFEYLTEVLLELGIQTNIYSLDLTNVNSQNIQIILDEAFIKINSENISSDLLLKLYKLWDYLAENDSLEKADLIYVFGGISKLAVEEAIRLKIENYAPKILFSGKRASYSNNNSFTEAEEYAKLALLKGVHENDILIEKESINTPENIVNSAKLLHEVNYLPKSVIAVSLPYHMKRASLTMKAGFEWDFKLIRHPGLSAKYSRENYFKDKNGWSYIFFEYLKLHGARKMGHF